MNYCCNLNKCKRLTLITSESCNLNCSYCLIAKATNKNKCLETENIKNSFNNGTYFNNIKQIFSNYNINSQEIYSMELWGQEPTLTLNEFSNSFKDFYTFLPNLNKLFFSTNGVAFPERIINLIVMLNNTITKPFTLSIQFSYDGYDATKNLRGVNPQIIIANISNIILQLNNIQINNLLSIKLNFHNVLSADLINKYGNQNINNDKEFYNYLKELSDLGLYFQSLNTNNQVYIGKIFGCGIENPYNATKENGQNFANFFRKAKTIGKDIEIHWWESVIDYFNNQRIKFPEKFNYSLDFYANLKKLNKTQFNLIGCQACYSGITVRYDGTLIHCQNAITYLNPQDYPNNDDLNFKLQKELVSKKYYPNLLKQDQNISVQKNLYRHQNFVNSCVFIITEIINLFYLLINANQVDESYKSNEIKILKHAMLVNTVTCCPDANLNVTGSLYGQDIGRIRLLCNGFLDILDEYYNERINNNEK